MRRVAVCLIYMALQLHVCTAKGTTTASGLSPSSASLNSGAIATVVSPSRTAPLAIPETIAAIIQTASVSPTPSPVFEQPVITYGDNVCNVTYMSEGQCGPVFSRLQDPLVITNNSRNETQAQNRVLVDTIISTLVELEAQEECITQAIPLLCRYSFPTCDPAFQIATYQPICRRDCEIMRDFVCKDPWAKLIRLILILDLTAIDQPDCEPLRGPNGGQAPMCISTLGVDEIPRPLFSGTECYRGKGRGYMGTINMTESGRSCQNWRVAYPHQHTLNRESYPEIRDHNSCRNPGERGDRPWCFTTDPARRWEYCPVPECEPGPVCETYAVSAGTTHHCRTTATIGKDHIYFDTRVAGQPAYQGPMASLLETISSYDDPCRSILAEFMCVSNYPSCDLSHDSPRPHWPCRTYCEHVKTVCQEDVEAFLDASALAQLGPINIEQLFNCSTMPEANGGEAPECYTPPPSVESSSILGREEAAMQTCYNTSDKGMAYQGLANETVGGLTCQKWNSQSPHVHSITPLFRRTLEGHNYCRNPEGRGERPWCYTSDPNVRWAYCNIPVCATGLPSYIYIIIGVGAGLLLLILFTCVLICCVCCCKRRFDKKVELDQNYMQRYTNPPVKVVGYQDVGGETKAGANPLYARNPLTVQEPIEYDGVKLPEYPRERIVYIRDLGQGHFGVVVQAEAVGTSPETGKEERAIVAVKVLKEGASVQVKKEFFKEAALMYHFDHPNILRLLGVCIEQEPLCMIFEFMEIGDLNNFLRQNAPLGKFGSNASLNRSFRNTRLSVENLVAISIHIAAGLEYLARNHYVHRDLATRNCLVNSNFCVKIADFGLSQDIYSTDYFRLGDAELLPIRWMPPEAILYAKFTTQSDVWSFGVVLWEIFSYGMQPYFSLSNEEVVQHVRDGNVMSYPEGCPQEIYDLMLDCWNTTPSERPTAMELHSGLLRWNPELSAALQQPPAAVKSVDYQNMATIREYATHNTSTSEGGECIEISEREDHSKGEDGRKEEEEEEEEEEDGVSMPVLHCEEKVPLDAACNPSPETSFETTV